MWGWVLAGLILAFGCGTLVIDLTKGATYASFSRGNGVWIRRKEMPLVYFVLLGVKALAALLLAALMTGWLQTLIEWSI